MNLVKEGVIPYRTYSVRRAIFADPGEGYWQLSYQDTHFDVDMTVPYMRLAFARWTARQPIVLYNGKWFCLDSDQIVTEKSVHGEALSDEQWQRILENPVPLIVRIALIS